MTDYSTSTSSSEKMCPICGQWMMRNTVGFHKWTCPRCGYHYEVITGDPPQDMELFQVHSDGVSSAYCKLEIYQHPFTLQIDADLIKLRHKEMDIEFELHPDKLANIDVIEINGYRYVKEKK